MCVRARVNRAHTLTRAFARPGAGVRVPCTTVRYLRVTGTCAIPLDELEWRFSGSGGPGGQHANTSNTRVELRFDIAGSPSLGPRQRERLLERLGPVVRVVVSDTRSQARNRELALDRLRERLAAALRTTRARRPTVPSEAARRRRVEGKRRRGELKRHRRVRPELED
jgi:ribosome-associated protein